MRVLTRARVSADEAGRLFELYYRSPITAAGERVRHRPVRAPAGSTPVAAWAVNRPEGGAEFVRPQRHARGPPGSPSHRPRRVSWRQPPCPRRSDLSRCRSGRPAQVPRSPWSALGDGMAGAAAISRDVLAGTQSVAARRAASACRVVGRAARLLVGCARHPSQLGAGLRRDGPRGVVVATAGGTERYAIEPCRTRFQLELTLDASAWWAHCEHVPTGGSTDDTDPEKSHG